MDRALAIEEKMTAMAPNPDCPYLPILTNYYTSCFFTTPYYKECMDRNWRKSLL